MRIIKPTIEDYTLSTHDHSNDANGGLLAAAAISDFDTEVSNNTDVAANTAARHDAVTVLDSSEIDFTLTGQQITASLIAGSIDETKLDASTNASLDLADSASQPGHTHAISDITNLQTTLDAKATKCFAISMSIALG